MAIWQAGVRAAESRTVTAAAIEADQDAWRFGAVLIDPTSFDRVVIVGGGKAAEGMVRGAFEALEPTRVEIQGWVNVPDEFAGQCDSIRLHGGRPWGTNEPTEAAVAGTRQMLKLASSLTKRDLCLCLLTGGASALISAPSAGVSLQEKLSVTRRLVAAGASIRELNAVRSCLSDVKGGGLARACRAGQIITLLISDVLGDDLATIASGPTVIDSRDPEAARGVIAKYLRGFDLPDSINKAIDNCAACTFAIRQ